MSGPVSRPPTGQPEPGENCGCGSLGTVSTVGYCALDAGKIATGVCKRYGQPPEDPVEKALRCIRFFAETKIRWGRCDGCDPGNEGSEIAGEVLAATDLLGSLLSSPDKPEGQRIEALEADVRRLRGLLARAADPETWRREVELADDQRSAIPDGQGVGTSHPAPEPSLGKRVVAAALRGARDRDEELAIMDWFSPRSPDKPEGEEMATPPTTADDDGGQRRAERYVDKPEGQIFEKLNEMQLHDATGDPHDEGYMAAVNELRDWLGR